MTIYWIEENNNLFRVYRHNGWVWGLKTFKAKNSAEKYIQRLREIDNADGDGL